MFGGNAPAHVCSRTCLVGSHTDEDSLLELKGSFEWASHEIGNQRPDGCASFGEPRFCGETERKEPNLLGARKLSSWIPNKPTSSLPFSLVVFYGGFLAPMTQGTESLGPGVWVKGSGRRDFEKFPRGTYDAVARTVYVEGEAACRWGGSDGFWGPK